MPEDYLYRLDQLRTPDRLWVGDKAFYLGLLLQKGYPVLPGLVVSSALLQSFLEQIEWLEPMFADLPHSSLYVDVDNARQLQSVAQQLRQTLQAAAFPDTWADELAAAIQPWKAAAVILRPSIALPSGFDPTVSLKTWGFMESIVCSADKDSIAQSLKQVWSELFRAKSLLYWQRLRIQLQQVHLAVLIQPIESVIASGDVQIHRTHLEIHAIWGLGRALVNGEVTPDCYHIDLQTGEQSHRLANKIYAYRVGVGAEAVHHLHETSCYRIEPIEPSEQARSVLTSEQLQQLIHLTQRTAADLGTHLRLEWALLPTTPPKLYLTQITPHLTMGRWEQADRKPLKPLIEHPLDRSPSSSSQVTVGLAAAPGRIIAPAWVSQHTTPPHAIPPGSILVTPQITPEWLPLLKQAAGIITEQGGMTSHAAVLARELGLPAVTGVRNVTQRIRTGEWLQLDGDRGEIQPISEEGRPGANQKEPTSSNQNFPDQELLDRLLAPRDLTLTDSSVIATQLFVTLSQPESIAKAASLPVDGVGLVRSELMLLEVLQHRHPSSWIEQGQRAVLIQRFAEQLQRFAQAFVPRPVFYRSSDLRADEFGHIGDRAQLPLESNPALGLRGTLRYQTEPTLFDIELAALRQVQQQGFDNLRLILPFVRTVEEFMFCRQRVEQAGLRQNPNFQLWMMAEVPSVLLLLPDYITAGIQGVAIGSNDFTQLLLGVDRNQAQLASAFNQRHPAVLQAMRQIIQTAKQAGIPCSLCGQAPTQYPEIIESLVRWGITAISVDPSDVTAIREAIGRAEQRILLELARQRLKS